MTTASMNPAFPAVGASIGAGLALWQSIETRNAVSRSLRNLATSTSLEMEQTDQSFALERRRMGQRAALAIGSLRASAAERGLTTAEGIGEAMVDVQIQNDAIDRQINETNRINNLNAQRRRYEASVSQLQAQAGNIVINTLQGALSGGLTGAQIGQFFPTVE